MDDDYDGPIYQITDNQVEELEEEEDNYFEDDVVIG